MFYNIMQKIQIIYSLNECYSNYSFHNYLNIINNTYNVQIKNEWSESVEIGSSKSTKVIT